MRRRGSICTYVHEVLQSYAQPLTLYFGCDMIRCDVVHVEEPGNEARAKVWVC